MTELKFRNDDKIAAKVYILESAEDIDKIGLNKDEADYVKKSYDDDKKKTVVINNQKELEDMFYKFINDEEFYKGASKICHDYVAGKIGATEKTMKILKGFLA